MAGFVYANLDATIESGGVEVQVEVIKDGPSITASLDVTDTEALQELTVEDMAALHKLTGDSLKAMKEAKS